MRRYRKQEFPLDQVRRFLEPGPIVLVSTQHAGERDVMTMGWHMMLGFSPALVACCIVEENHSFQLARRSGECVINLPTADIVDTVVRIGNSSGSEIDKYEAFGLATTPGSVVDVPLLDHCHSSFECRLHDDALVERYNLFVWEVVKAHVAPVPKLPRTVHYRGDGRFMRAGEEFSRKRLFKPEML